MKVAVVGAGPGGALLAWRLARQGISVSLFDASHPREKPCGGGLTARALRELPKEPDTDPLPAHLVTSCTLDAGGGGAVEVEIDQPMKVASRRDFDLWLLRRATSSGARHVSERVVSVERGRVRTSSGREETCDLVVGADGATSLVRRAFLPPLTKERLTMAAGWYAPGTSPMWVRFVPPGPGYLWLFPRRDHVGVGICAPLGSQPTRALVDRLEREILRSFPALADLEGERYAHMIPSPTADPRSILEIGGDGFALVGDAGALADPLTGEGIFHALRSATLLAETLVADGSAARYAESVLEDFGRDVLKAAALRDRFYAPGFTSRMIRYAGWSPAIRSILGDLLLGTQGYIGLKRRLLKAGPRFLLEAGISKLLGQPTNQD